MEESSDEALMARAGKGDEAAFRVLAERHLHHALRLARRILQNGSDAEDIVQEALLRVWINAPRWRPEAAVRTWLYRIIVNLCLNARRRAPFVALDAAGDRADPAADPARQLEATESDRQVAGAVASLPERQRVALVLTYFEELSNAETSAILGTSISGVEALLVRARRTLRQTLVDDEH
jgi:RNA polymerase sigma-70 factor (ECF subfamily)